LSRRFGPFFFPEGRGLAGGLAGLAGVVYFSVGFLQIASLAGVLPPITGQGDLLTGLLLIIVAAVFLKGIRPLSEGTEEGYAHLVVGYMLATILFGLQVLVIGTNALGWLLQFPGWVEWSLAQDLTPQIWLFAILVVVSIILRLAESPKEVSE